MEKKAFFSNPNRVNWQMESSDAGGPLPSLTSGHLNLIWDQTIDQAAKFDSTALSPHACSPSSNPPTARIGSGGDCVVIRELIGRLGSICNSEEISPASSHYQSANNSCYSTPMNSPPKLNLSFVTNPVQMSISDDPAFAERAARCSTFTCSGGRGHCGGQFLLPESSASGNAKKRKATPLKGKGKEAPLSSSIATLTNPPKTAEEEGLNGKRIKSSEEARDEDSTEQQGDATASINIEEKGIKPPDISKDYIHVRARRGQATDSHSLAERVRREKISERMKLLQDLVPGCNKVTGKAVMLDEIINYVQSLQRQVEFLSMKLATVNPQLDFNMENFVTKNIEIHQNSVLLHPQSVYPFETISNSLSFGNLPDRSPLIAINGLELESHSNFNNRNLSMQLPPLEGFADGTYQLGPLWEDDLQNVVQMGFIHNQEHLFSSQSIQGFVPTNHMKVEL